MWYKTEPDEFGYNYTPTYYPKATYLLSETRWGTSHKTWTEGCGNDSKHAEIIFLEYRKHIKIVKQRINTPCHITWYLSWTPCGSCAQKIINFLEEYNNVTLEIKAARVYRPHDWRNPKGLRNLYHGSGVQISIMDQDDYQYCWRTFVDHQGEVFFPPDTQHIHKHSRCLYSILNYNF